MNQLEWVIKEFWSFRVTFWCRNRAQEMYRQIRRFQRCSGNLFVTHPAVYQVHTVVLLDCTFKKWALVLPSSIARNLSAPNSKRIFQILWGILEGRTNSARPSRPCLKNGTFWSVHGIWFFGGLMTSFDMLLKCHSLTLSKKMSQAPSSSLKVLI